MKPEQAIDLIESKAVSKEELNAKEAQDHLLEKIRSDSVCRAELDKIRKSKEAIINRCDAICMKELGQTVKMDLGGREQGLAVGEDLGFYGYEGTPYSILVKERVKKVRNLCFKARLALVSGDAAEVIKKLAASLGLEG